MLTASLHKLARALAKRPAAFVAGATALTAGVWMAQSQLNARRSTLAHAGTGDALRGSQSSPISSSAGDAAARGAALPGLRLRSAAVMIPHPAKEDRGGEDAYFIGDQGTAVGVADGVGGWAEVGVDPGLYSRELMGHAQVACNSVKAGPSAPAEILTLAHAATAARGSCTACILVIEGNELHAANLGDSGFMIVRGDELAFMSPQQQHDFNFPFQIGSPDSMSDFPSAAQRFSLKTYEGDVLVLATDGVFDNVYPDEAVSLVAAQRKRGATPGEAAAALAQFARQRAGDQTHLSPFAYGAQQRGYRFFGGKMDDITALVAYVCPGEGAEAADPPADTPVAQAKL
ncbi:putative protein phosphatase 2C 80 [Auxenochlorella protothecoides]|nr:putative protein phosphatase 2C 80 [Auxenochlorella protothecoides]KFM24954.1 putative protein phosphatase 2C 80 [Auxenochlorella protothecoides]RMZ52917.1 hypothetical protein APUTEX25_001036 [Auxenochlorella protothecoides]|eukprot:RMZ52917.1 hypothetical protein APUTEX25_001036 [Auxenochlorella protothecoides]